MRRVNRKLNLNNMDVPVEEKNIYMSNRHFRNTKNNLNEQSKQTKWKTTCKDYSCYKTYLRM